MPDFSSTDLNASYKVPDAHDSDDTNYFHLDAGSVMPEESASQAEQPFQRNPSSSTIDPNSPITLPDCILFTLGSMADSLRWWKPLTAVEYLKTKGYGIQRAVGHLSGMAFTRWLKYALAGQWRCASSAVRTLSHPAARNPINNGLNGKSGLWRYNASEICYANFQADPGDGEVSDSKQHQEVRLFFTYKETV